MTDEHGYQPIVPDVLGEAVGWRAWTVLKPETPHPRLRSANAGGQELIHQIWPPERWMIARCPYGHEYPDIPVTTCSCGLYAAKTLDHLLDMRYACMSEGATNVIGEVGMTGRVIEGTQGWKAAKARVLKLYVPLQSDALGQHLSDVFNVPYEVVAWWALEQRLRGF